MFGKRENGVYRNKCKVCTKNALKVKSDDVIVKCSTCNKEKQYILFAKGSNTCKVCRNKYEKERRDSYRDKLNQRAREVRLKNKDVINARKREKEQIRRDNDPKYRLRHNLSTRLWLAVSKKMGKTFDLVGCSHDDLISHLESKFIDGMTWDNYGKWHVDHIRPCSSFDLSNVDQQKECFHWSNLQPLWAYDNMSKGPR